MTPTARRTAARPGRPARLSNKLRRGRSRADPGEGDEHDLTVRTVNRHHGDPTACVDRLEADRDIAGSFRGDGLAAAGQEVDEAASVEPDLQRDVHGARAR